MHKQQDQQPNDDHRTRLPQGEHGSLVGARLGSGHERLHPILRLQRQIGNRATQRYLQRRPSIQREVPYSQIADDAHAEVVRDYIGQFHDAVQKAYAIVLHKPMLEEFGEVDGHIDHWRETWQAYTNRQAPALPAAAFGYAVESITGILLPKPPDGYVVQAQQTRGGTRPDFVLSLRGGGDVAWLDITASNSESHIFNKDGWDRIAHFAEITYPSTSMEQIALVANSDAARDFNYEGIDPSAVAKQLEEAKQIQANRRAYWQMTGESLFGGPLPHADPISRDRVRMHHAIGILNHYLGGQVLNPVDTSHQRIAASILVAMNVNPTTYGFVAYSTTRSLGESFLQELDPNVPTVDARLRESKAIASEIAALGVGEIDTEDFFSRK